MSHTRSDRTAVAHEVGIGGGDRRYRPIADYAMIGNAQSAALVASDGAIDWICLPHFDSPAILCRLLDADKGGYLTLHPSKPVRRTLRRYREASNVLETTFETESGALRLVDTMPVAADESDRLLDGVWSGRGRHRVIRLVEAVDGPIDAVLATRLSFDFAATPATIELEPGKGAIASDGAGQVIALVWGGSLHVTEAGELRGDIGLDRGESIACVLAYVRSMEEAHALLDGEDWASQIAATDAAWRRWATCCVIEGPYGHVLRRSALTLRMLSFEPTGAVVAAPTTSLPEAIGGVRNWDYRFCWLRDATFTLYALLLVGDRTAAHAFWHWIEQTCAGDSPERLQIMYGIHGERALPERTLDHLSGYRDSRPVRVGNAVWSQRQLDVYGELLDAFWFYYQHGGEDGQPPPVDPDIWRLLSETANYICDIWREPDQGLWEMRSEPRHFVYSKVMCWVGLDRALRLAGATGLTGDTARWTAECAAIRSDILLNGYSETAGAFTMAYGTDALDAAALRLLLVGFLPADDPRMRSTIEQVQAKLEQGGLVRRYVADDGLPIGEGAFSICTFWLVDCLTALGRIDEARALFEKMLGFASDLGLFAEEVDVRTGAALGNYPQAFTHLALIDAGVDLTEALARRAPLPSESTDRAETVRAGRAARGESSEGTSDAARG